MLSSQCPLMASSQGENDLFLNTDEPCGIETLEGNREAELMNQLVPVFFGRNPDWGSTFRSIYSAFITSQQVLELLFPSAVPINPGTWMEQYSEAFHQPLGLMILQLLLPYLQLYMGGLNLERQAHHLLAQLEDGKSSEAEPEFQEAWATDSLPMPTPGLEPHQGAALVASEGAAPSPEAELKSSTPKVSAPSSTVPLYNQRVGDSCSIHVHLENQRRMEYKNIVVTCQDRAPAVIRRALQEHLLNEEDPEDFELLQIVSEHKMLRIPADGNVFYAINPRVDFDFVLRKRVTRKWANSKTKEFLESTSLVTPRIPQAVSSSSSVAARPLPQATESKDSGTNSVTNSSSLLPHYNEQAEDSSFIQVHLEEQTRRNSQHILLSESTSEASAMECTISPASSHISSQQARPNPTATKHMKKSRAIGYITGRCSWPRSKKQVKDSCLINVRLEHQNAKDGKTILVTCNDRAPTVIRRALEHHLLMQEKPQDYELGQIISQQHKMKIPKNANVFYAMKPHVRRDFILRKRTYPQDEKDDWIPPQPPSYEATQVRHHRWNLWTRICSCLSGQC
ncbi:ral guanine nucleotide dissociation stimulator-like isoform X3 [Sciurus carolinensis]|uniref:ral guanine nucleotide dissociation stimulator-like isoform X3 n=1 Tax=Sciurus carolinensis TaxID=30640 RepID=UPI001FB4EA44|nr:ral guanine nucleotide dissociation stimulator-like isoform X3 [Sciurus carolinensis]XP_047393464.1 ral guanine nucleotide dissociation stimulator-like isoform X3 [Sciurus carolinensis]